MMWYLLSLVQMSPPSFMFFCFLEVRVAENVRLEERLCGLALSTKKLYVEANPYSKPVSCAYLNAGTAIKEPFLVLSFSVPRNLFLSREKRFPSCACSGVRAIVKTNKNNSLRIPRVVIKNGQT